MLDLHLFYKEVTVRGGFHHVTKYRRWDEVVFALKLEANHVKFRTQLQILYALLLFKFEQTYFYREPAKAAKAPDCSAMKRKNGDNFFDLTEIEDDVEMKKMCKGITFPMFAGPRIAEPKLSPQTPSKKKETKRRPPSKKKETKRRPGATRGLRTAYNIFLKEECARLRTVHGKSLQGQNIREMAVDAWRCLPESKRQPYIEESKKERERVVKQKAALKDQQNMQNTKTQETCLDDDYHVTLETNVEKFHVPDESTVKTNVENFLVLDESTASLAITTMKNPIFQIDCFGSLDIPCEGSKLL
uniref:HMG box domain-containing protein n=1 Tax=Fagus sylvatica TaxID=28930 RepID=A0A2N9EPQ6_FAGSY